MEGKRKEEREGEREAERGRMCQHKCQELGNQHLERGSWGPRGPPRLEEPLHRPGSPRSLSWLRRSPQSWAWVLFGEQAAHSRRCETPCPAVLCIYPEPLPSRGVHRQKEEQACRASPRDRRQILHPPALPCPPPVGHACLSVQVQFKQMLCS